MRHLGCHCRRSRWRRNNKTSTQLSTTDRCSTSLPSLSLSHSAYLHRWESINLQQWRYGPSRPSWGPCNISSTSGWPHIGNHERIQVALLGSEIVIPFVSLTHSITVSILTSGDHTLRLEILSVMERTCPYTRIYSHLEGEFLPVMKAKMHKNTSKINGTPKSPHFCGYVTHVPTHCGFEGQLNGPFCKCLCGLGVDKEKM